MTTMHEVEELLVQPDEHDPRCQFRVECPQHGMEDCGRRARWIATLHCGNPGHATRQLLACDDCHDYLVSDTGVLDGHDRITGWRPL